MRQKFMPVAVQCLAVFALSELFVAFWIAFFIICPRCWPFPQPMEVTKSDPFCLDPPCVRKCCPQGEEIFRDTVNEKTLCNATDNSTFALEMVPLWTNDSQGQHVAAETYDRFTIINYGLCPDGFFLLDPAYKNDENALLANGSLVLVQTNTVVEHSEYCIDTFSGLTGTNVFRCFGKPNVDGLSEMEIAVFPIALAISIPFLLATIFVYVLLPELKNLHGKCLLCHVFSLCVAYIVLMLIQTNFLYMNVDHPTLCVVCAFVIQFSFLATFFWLNVMCFDIWWVFSGLRPLRGSVKEREHKKFIYYSLYAWGCPLIIFIISLVMELVPSIPDTFIKPRFGVDKCWFKDSKANVLYFYLPIGVLVLLNIAMFATTAFRLRVHTRETKVLQSSESRRNDEAERQRFNLYLKLFVVMGINWVMKLVSFVITQVIGGPKSLWFVTDLGNTLQGLLIFLIFVCKKRILRLLNQKLCPRWEIIAATNSSRSKTEKQDSAKTNSTKSTKLYTIKD